MSMIVFLIPFGTVVFLTIAAIFILERKLCEVCRRRKFWFQWAEKFEVNSHDYSIYKGICKSCVKNDTLGTLSNGDHLIFDRDSNLLITVTREEIYGVLPRDPDNHVVGIRRVV